MRKGISARSFLEWRKTVGQSTKRRFIMFRFVRYSVLGLVLALPFAMPTSSEAATFWYRPVHRPIVVVNSPVRVVAPVPVIAPVRVWGPFGYWRGGVFYRR
jgi:hypothetical protein